MTKQQFLAAHGAEWSKIVSSPAFKAMLHIAKVESPQHKSVEWTPGDVVAGGSILFAQMQGYTLFERLITEELMLALPDPQPQESYDTDPTVPPEDHPEQP